MVDTFGLNPYATFLRNEDTIFTSKLLPCGGFDALKLREAQNLDWAEDSIYRGL